MSKFFLVVILASAAVASCMAKSLEVPATVETSSTKPEIETRDFAQWLASQNWQETVKPNGDREYSLYSYNPQVTLFGKTKPAKGKRSVEEDSETEIETRDLTQLSQLILSKNWDKIVIDTGDRSNNIVSPVDNPFKHIKLPGQPKPTKGKRSVASKEPAAPEQRKITFTIFEYKPSFNVVGTRRPGYPNKK